MYYVALKGRDIIYIYIYIYIYILTKGLKKTKEEDDLMLILRLNGTEGILSSLIWTFVIMNFGLAFFNLLPFYPMDGGRLIVSLLPLKVINWLACRERLFSFVAIFLVVLLPVFLYIIFGKNKMNYFSHEILVFTDLLTRAPHMSWFSHMYKWMRII